MDDLRAQATELRGRVIRTAWWSGAECYAGAFVALRSDGTAAVLGWVGAIAAAAVVVLSLCGLREINGVLRDLDRRG